MTEPTSSPLAEGRWLWRRLYAFLASCALLWLLANAIDRIEPEDLPPIASGLMGLLALTVILYLVAPTAQQLMVLVADLRSHRIRGGAR
ncbi:hypothetical protein MMB232_02548 [Brevundimonas subvibrioides]|uniref:hypothetical protein n=1 Tax=Brevundimonas subvibrioides TaxID=74313 RepID=UPI0032D57A59